MSEDTETQGTQAGTETGSGAAPQSDPRPTAQPRSPEPSLPVHGREDIFAKDGSMWRDKFNGAQGQIGNLNNQISRLKQEMEDMGGGHSSELQAKDDQISQLQSEIDQLQQTTGTIPGLQEQLEQLKPKAVMADRYRMVMRYPGVLNLSVEEEVQVEGEDEPQVVSVNPVLQLIETTTLEGEALEQAVKRLARLHGQSVATQLEDVEPVATPAGGPAFNSPAPPSPAGPSEESAQFWYDKAIEYKGIANETGDKEAMEKMREAFQKHEELLKAQMS